MESEFQNRKTKLIIKTSFKSSKYNFHSLHPHTISVESSFYITGSSSYSRASIIRFLKMIYCFLTCSWPWFLNLVALRPSNLFFFTLVDSSFKGSWELESSRNFLLGSGGFSGDDEFLWALPSSLSGAYLDGTLSMRIPGEFWSWALLC